MSQLKNVSQKISGKAEQLKGEVEIATGQVIKGNISKIRGKAKELEADVKIKLEQ